jgi:hypothetical protein
VLIQPMAADDVASAVAEVTVGPPANGIVEIAGPQQFRLDELLRRPLSDRHDPRDVWTCESCHPNAAMRGRPAVEAPGLHPCLRFRPRKASVP